MQGPYIFSSKISLKYSQHCTYKVEKHSGFVSVREKVYSYPVVRVQHSKIGGGGIKKYFLLKPFTTLKEGPTRLKIPVKGCTFFG